MRWKTAEIAFPGIAEKLCPNRLWGAPDGRHVVIEEVCWEPRKLQLRVYAAADAGLSPGVTIDVEGEVTPNLSIMRDALAWMQDGQLVAARFADGARTGVPEGCAFIGGFPLFLGAAANEVSARDWRTYAPFKVSPDARWFGAPSYRHEVDVIFSSQPVEEAKALAKKQRVLALSNHAVAVSTKTGEWALLSIGTWKKLGAGTCVAGIREAHFSPEGAYLALVAGKTITLMDAQTAAVVSEQEMPNTVEYLAWLTGQRLVCKLYNQEGQGLAQTFIVLDPALPVRMPTEPTLDAKPAKKTKAKPSRSAELGLPFELEWSQPESVLRDVLKGKPHGAKDRALVEAEAAILDPSFRGEPMLLASLYGGSLAAALLLRAPACAAYFDELLATHLDHADVQAVLPLLSESGQGRLACTQVLAGRALDQAQRRALSRFIVLDVWASPHATKVTQPGTGGRISSTSSYELVAAYCSSHGDAAAFSEAMHALWESGRAKSIKGHEAELQGDFASFALAIAKNPAHARAALGHRASIETKDQASDVAAWVTFIDQEPAKANDARVPQLAYALTVLAREGQPLPAAARDWLVRAAPITEVEARALAHFADAPTDDAFTKAWVAAVRGDYSVLEGLLAALCAGKRDAALVALVDFVVASAPVTEAHRLAMTMIGKPQLDPRAFSLLLRARDAGLLKEDIAWFTAPPTLWDRSAALRTCSEALQKAVLAHWLETGTCLLWAANFDFAAAAREAILRADPATIPVLFTKERRGEWMPLVRLHLPASKDPEAVLITLRYMGPSKEELEDLRKLARGEETRSMRIHRLLDALPGPKKTMTFFFEPHEDADVGAEAQSTYVCGNALEGEDTIVSIALADVPALRLKFPAAASLTVYGKRGKNPRKVPTRIALHEATSPEHQALEAAPKRLRCITLDVPEDLLGDASGRRPHRVLHEALPTWRFIATPHYTFLPTPPLVAVRDVTVVELEEDEGEFLIFESSTSHHRG